jgi:hypothetical protein
MPAIDIPDPLPPAITPDREVIELFIDEDLAEFGHDSLVARTWHWVLHGGRPGPISHMDWRRFDGDAPPSAATLAAESTASEPPPARPLAGTNSTGPGTSAGSAPPNPATNYHSASTPGTLPPHRSPPKKARSPSPSAKTPVTDAQKHRQRKHANRPDVSQPVLLVLLDIPGNPGPFRTALPGRRE